MISSRARTGGADAVNLKTGCLDTEGTQNRYQHSPVLHDTQRAIIGQRVPCDLEEGAEKNLVQVLAPKALPELLLLRDGWCAYRHPQSTYGLYTKVHLVLRMHVLLDHNRRGQESLRT